MTSQRKFASFEDAFTAPAQPPVAANDNKPAAKTAPHRYRGTLPALRWLFDHDPIAAEAVAAALPKSEAKTWSEDVVATNHEIRPTEGELLKAASDAFRVYVRDGIRHVGKGYRRLGGEHYSDDEWQLLGDLRFFRGKLQTWGVTKKGKKLKPVDRITSGNKQTSRRNPGQYLKAPPAVASPLHAESYQRPMSGEPAIPPMYDPIEGVERNREVLAQAYADSPNVPVKKCPTVVAKGASFIGGVSRSKGNNSAGAQMWEGPEERKGEAHIVLEEVAARGTLKSIGERLGYKEGYADRAGKRALLDAARVLIAANDNRKKKVAA